jgi:hypothetical protein
MQQYEDRLTKAAKELKQVLTSESPSSLISDIRFAVETALEDEFLEGMGDSDEDNSVQRLEVLDDMEFDFGRTAAETYARAQGITDEAILEKVREFGFHIAALWIQSGIEKERDIQAGVDEPPRDPDEDHDL